MKPADVKSSAYTDLNRNNNKEDHNLKSVNMFQIGLKKFLLKRLKILSHGDMLLAILKVKKLLEEKNNNNCKKQIKENL